GARVRPPGRTGGASGSERLRHSGERNRSRNGTPSPLLGKSRSEQRRIQDHRRVLARSRGLTEGAISTCSEAEGNARSLTRDSSYLILPTPANQNGNSLT